MNVFKTFQSFLLKMFGIIIVVVIKIFQNKFKIYSMSNSDYHSDKETIEKTLEF